MMLESQEGGCDVAGVSSVGSLVGVKVGGVEGRLGGPTAEAQDGCWGGAH